MKIRPIYRLFAHLHSLKRFYNMDLAQTTNHQILTQKVSEIYSLPTKTLFSMQITGGGMQCVDWFLTVPGASSCILNVEVPYARASATQFLSQYNGHDFVEPSKSVSEEMSLALAKASCAKSVELVLRGEKAGAKPVLETLPNISTIFGVGCTAALMSTTPKKGAHRCHVAVYSANGSSSTYSVELNKGQRDRWGEDYVCARLVLDAVTLQMGLPLLPDSLLLPEDQRAPLSKSNIETYATGVADAACGGSSGSCSGGIGAPGTDSLGSELSSVQQPEKVRTVHCRALSHPLHTLYELTTSKVLFVRKPCTQTQTSMASAAADAVTSSANVVTITDKNDETDTAAVVAAAVAADLYAKYHCFEDAHIPRRSLVYPGSFNPLHDGHAALVRAALDAMAEKKAGTSSSASVSVSSPSSSSFPPEPLVVFEISALNADKPPLLREEVMRRVAQFDVQASSALAKYGITNYAVCVTSEPLFAGKAGLFPGCTFLIGADTMTRLLNPKYYADKEVAPGATSSNALNVLNMVSALTGISSLGCSFIVGGRAASAGDSVFETCDMVLNSPMATSTQSAQQSSTAAAAVAVKDSLPRSILDMFTGLPEDSFRLDLSSTEIRQQLQREQQTDAAKT
jgi:hypothetical protein